MFLEGNSVKRHTKIGLVVIVAFVGLCGISLWQVVNVGYGVGVGSVRWLPPEAHDITYLRNYLTTLAEFDIEQKAFERWCASRKMALRKLGDEERYVIRSVAMLEQRGVIPTVSEANEVRGSSYGHALKRFHAGDLFYEDPWPNGGGYWVGYDIEERRGYYRFCHH
jgi:hypothetical protein